jgi:acetylornithine aminotransferase
VGHAGFNYTSAIVEEAAEEILTLLGMQGGRCVFLCSGSEAVEYGVRVAQAVADRPLLITMADSYFGAYGSAARRDRSEWFGFDWLACAGCPEREARGKACPHWAEIPFDGAAGFLFEPGSSSGLVRFPPSKLVGDMVATVKEGGGLVLVNEVTTGVGRTGTWFGFEHYGIRPDVVALGKGIGNTYPVSVTAFAPGIVERLEGRPFKYAQSHQNDPLGAAVALEVVRTIREDGLIERGREIAGVLIAGLDRIRGRTDRIREIRARGLMVALELRDDADTSFTGRLHRELIERGFLVGRRAGVSVLRIDPSLTIEHADIQAFLATLEELLAAGE